jgi:hypothetical protein
LKGVGEPLNGDDYEARMRKAIRNFKHDIIPWPIRDFKHDNIPWPDFVQSAQTCYCCNILLRGVRGCLEQRELDPDQVELLDFSFLYTFVEGEVKDCDKDITCSMVNRDKFVIEFFTLTGVVKLRLG